MNWRPNNAPPKGSSNFIPLFRNPVNRFMPSAKNVVSGIILPMFNWDYPVGSAEWKQGYASYRATSADQIDEKGHREVIVPCAFLRVHTRIGNKEEDIVSPASREGLMPTEINASTDDPLIDIMSLASKEDSPWHALTQDGSGKNGYSLLSWPSHRILFNVVAINAKDAGQPHKQGVMNLPKAAFAEFQHLMNITRMTSNVPTPRDPDWPDYLYGDVCNPNRPLIFRTIQRTSTSNSGQKYQGLVFSSNEVSLVGAEQGAAVPASILENRINLWDPTVYNILTYQQIVDHLIADGFLPIELIKLACGGKANIGGTQATGLPEKTASVPQQAWQTQPAALTQPAADNIPLEETNYWINLPTGPVKEARSAIQFRMDAEIGFDPMIMTEDQQSGWVPASTKQFVVKKAAPTPPAPPAAPTPPAPPAAPTPPAPPAAPTPPAAAQAPEAEYWVIHSPAQNGVPALLKASELQALVNSGAVNADVMNKEQTSGWKKPADFGFNPPAAPTPPAPPAAPTPPAPPAATTPPAPPADDAPWGAPPSAPAAPMSQGTLPTGADPALESMPFYDELKDLSPSELEAKLDVLVSALVKGSVTKEDADRMSTIGMLQKRNKG